jgi:hypothetical protein
MKTLVLLEIEHRKPIKALANMIAGRAYTIDGVTNAEVFRSPMLGPEQLQDEGFSLAEISLGAETEVHRT